MTDEQLTRKATAGTLTFEEKVEYLMRFRGLARKDAMDVASGPPKNEVKGDHIDVH